MTKGLRQRKRNC